MNNEYIFDNYYCFDKIEFNGRLEAQLGSFGEQLIMTILGRMKKYKVMYVDHEGADLIATENLENSDEESKVYAISVKSHQIGLKESQVVSFSYKDQVKLTQFAYDFKAIPVIAEVIISKDFSFIDIFILRLKKFAELADLGERRKKELQKQGSLGIRDNGHNYPELSIGRDSDNGLTINNYAFNGYSKKYEENKYTEYLYNHKDINHMRIDMKNRLKNDPLGGSFNGDININLLKEKEEDGNLGRQLGAFGEYLAMFVFGRLKKYKIARVDFVGIDLIATRFNSEEKPYAISVKTRSKESKYTYTAEEIEKIVKISSQLNYIPALVYITPRRTNNFEAFDFYFMTLDTQIKYANEVDPWVRSSFGDIEASLDNYMKLPIQKRQDIKFENNSDLRQYIEGHSEIEYIEINFTDNHLK